MTSRSHCVILSLLVCAVFGNSLLNGFVWDDYFYLVNNSTYVDFRLDRIWLSLANGVEYLPVRDMSYALDYAIWGNNPRGFHLTNIVLYALSVMAVYGLVCKLRVFYDAGEGEGNSASAWVPLLAAVFFAVHPLHSEIASFITCRNAILSTLFFILSCYCHILFLDGKGLRRKLYYAAGFACFAVSLLAKVTSITLPLIVLLLTFRRYGENVRKAVGYAIPHGLLAIAAFSLHTFIAQKSYVFSPHAAKVDAGYLLSKLAVALQIPWFYVGKLLVPLGLSVEYDTQFADSIISIKATGGLLLIAGAICLAVKWRKKYPLRSFCLCWYFVTLIPVLNIFPTHPVVADRYAYLPSFALCCLLASLVLQRGNTKAAVAVSLALVISWSGLSMQRNMVWKSNTTLWENTVKTSPGSENANTHMGRIYFLEGKYDQAFYFLDRARRLNFRSPDYDFFCGNLAFIRGDFRGAITQFNRALTRNPQFIEALYYQGSAHEAIGENAIAADYYRMTLESPEPDIMGLKPLAREKVYGTKSQP
ncbi:MAG TPA: tetratricopeptide repeat protein [Geobacteraceae bacterium]|nr:tetratricopeptide repeat protein [Geobacteraceae bacterium]